MYPKVSVIIPTYNRAKYVRDAIGSVLNQTYKDFEIIVVDDGSTDNTEDFLNPYIKENKIRYFWQQNSGPSKARNRGIKESRGEYIAFLDSDDLWLPQKLSTLMDFIQQHSEFEVVHCDLVFFKNGNILDNNFAKNGIRASGWIFEDYLLLKSLVFLSCLLVKKSVLDSAGVFNESLYTAEDTNLIIRIAKNYQFGFVDEILVKRKIHEENLSLIGVENFGTFKSLDFIAQLYPELHPSRSRLMRKAYRYRYERMASSSFHRNDYLKARSYYLQALRMNRINLKDIIFIGLSFLPKNFLIRLKKKRKNLMRLIQWY